MKKGDIIEGVIEEVKFPNRGIFHNDWGRIEVKNVLPGQKVRVRIGKKRNGQAEAALLEVLEKAPDEVEAPCPKFGQCGGCTYLNLPYDKELTLKQIQVMKLLQQGLDEGCRMLPETEKDPVQRPDWQNVFTWYEGIHSSPKIFGFRNKMEFTFGDEVKGGPMTLGMHQRGSFHDIVDADECVIVDEDYRKIIRATRDFFAEREIPFYHRFQQEGYLRHLLVRKAAHTGEILVDLVTTSHFAGSEQGRQEEKREEQNLLKAYADMLTTLPLEGDIAGVLHTRNDSLADVVEDQGTEVLYGRAYFEESLLGLKFIVTPFSFFQTNSYGAETLYTIVRQYIMQIVPPVYDEDDPSDQSIPTEGSGSRVEAAGSKDPDDALHEEASEKGTSSSSTRPLIYDLYCGTGTISQLVAPVARKVIGVEIVPEAVEAARENAVRNHVDNCEFICGDVLKTLDTIAEKPDLIILDPPRDGVHPKALPKILAYGVEYILYISCKPTSLSRDLPAFIAAGYRPVQGCSVDQFCWSGNVESIVLLRKRKVSAVSQ